MKKLKHVKLFEAFSNSSNLVITGYNKMDSDKLAAKANEFGFPILGNNKVAANYLRAGKIWSIENGSDLYFYQPSLDAENQITTSSNKKISLDDLCREIGCTENDIISKTENFSGSEGYSIVGVFMETQMAVAVLPTREANEVYKSLLHKASETTDIEITVLPPNHDLVVVPLEGLGISTSTEEKLAKYGSPVHDIVELGKHYDYGDNNKKIVFRANRDVHGFVLLDSSGGTSLLTPKEMIAHIY